MVETIKRAWDLMPTSEYTKIWTEKSTDSKLWSIKSIMNNTKLSYIKEVMVLKDKIKNREYREFQRIIWISYNRCDWKLWNESLTYFKNYINKVCQLHNIVLNTQDSLWSLKVNIWQIENVVDTTRIQRNEANYLATHETMSQSEYNRLFSGKERLQQWQLGDCYLVSWINELARAQHFDTLMRTSIQRMKRNNGELWYQIKMPFWEPSWRKILIKDSEIKVAQIRWNNWYKLLELAYAKDKLRKNDRNGNRYRPMTHLELQKIKWWWTHEVLQKFLGKNNIWFSDFWTINNYKHKKTLAESPQNTRNEIHNFLKNYIPSIWNKFVSLASLPWVNDKKSYLVKWKRIYCWHAYSLAWVKKNKNWEIESIEVLNPWNNEFYWGSHQNFTLNEFFASFSAISCGKIKTKTFLGNKETS